MKKLLLLSLLAVSGSALAQVAGPAGLPPQSPAGGKHAGRMDKREMAKINEEILAKMNITADQMSKIKAHEEETKTKLLTLKKSNKGAKGAGKSEDVKEKMKTIRKENQEFMKTVLTKDQLKEMAKLRREAIKEYREKNGTAPTKP